jgi:Undecaprenyl-phosphate glucose phosphotransferase
MPSSAAAQKLALAPDAPDAAAPQHAEAALAQHKPSDRRGPFRPGRLVSAASRMNSRSISRLFRFFDLLIVGIMAWIACRAMAPAGLLTAPLGHVLPFVFGTAAASWGLEASGAYDFAPREPLSVHLLKTAGGFVLGALGMGLVLLAAAAPASVAAAAGLWLALCASVVYLAHAAWWAMVARWRRMGKLTPNIVVVGATANAERLILDLLQTREAAVLGVFDDRLGRVPDAICGVPVLGTAAEMIGHRVMPYVDRVVITVPSMAQGRVREIVRRLHVLPNDVSLFLDFQADAAAGAAVSQLASAPLAQVCGAPRDEARAFWKRMQDIVIGAIGFVLALPVMVLVALAVRLDSRGPILFSQRRHGFNNEEIVVWKFRSMRHDAADATASRQVAYDDERVTRVGRFIRKFSLDELPQILNVLKGDMSLVGPRPHAIGMKTGDEESARLVAEYAHRHRLKPGITGWAAIHGSRGPVHTPADVRRRVELDIEYIERQSFWLDLYIMAMTLPCLLGDRSAVR